MKLVAINPCLFYADDADFLGQGVRKTQITIYKKNDIEIIVEKGFGGETLGKETTWKTQG
jgi:hypothetical protein